MAKEVAVVNNTPDELLLAEAERLGDPELISQEIMRRILEAETVEEVLEMAGTTSAKDIVGVAFTLTDAVIMKSAFDEGAPVYMLLDVADPDTGKAYKVNCGGRNVMAQVYRLKQLGALPTTVKLVEAGTTAAGHKPLWLNKA